jgi:ketosteroid isomerase-like protein
MKRFLLCCALAFVVATIMLSQLNCAAPATNSNTAPNANAANKTSTTNTTTTAGGAVESDLMQMERDWAKAVTGHDVDGIKRIEADDFAFVDPSGTIGGQADDVKDAENKSMTVGSWDINDMKVHVYSDDVATVTGRTTLKNGKYKGKDGKEMDISGDYNFIDTYVKRNGRWQVVASAAVKLPKT